MSEGKTVTLKTKKKEQHPSWDQEGFVQSVLPANLSCYLIKTVQKLGFLKLDCPLAASEPIVSLTMCPLAGLGNSIMSLSWLGEFNHVPYKPYWVYSVSAAYFSQNTTAKRACLAKTQKLD